MLNANGEYTQEPNLESDLEPVVTDIVMDAVVASLAFLMYRRFRGAPAPRTSIGTTFKTFIFAQSGTAAGFTVVGMLTGLTMLLGLDLARMNFPNPEVGGSLSLVLTLISDAMAGPTEEIALMALVVVALRKAGQGWGVIIVVAILVRVPFHMYYGWEAIGLAVWATLTVLLYKRTGNLLGIILSHSAWNVRSGLMAYGVVPEYVGTWTIWGCLFGTLLTMALVLRPWQKKPQPELPNN